MSSICRLADVSDHGGTIITSSDDSFCNERGIARAGDLHQCPRRGHGITPLIPITMSSYVNDRLIITTGARAGCGATIISGSPDSFSE